MPPISPPSLAPTQLAAQPETVPSLARATVNFFREIRTEPLLSPGRTGVLWGGGRGTPWCLVEGRGGTHLPRGAATLSSPSLHLDSAWRLWLQNKRYLLLLATND